MVAAVSTFSMVLTSCEKDDPNPTSVDEPTTVTSYDNGLFITCEGPFNSGAGTGTVSFFNRSSNTVSNDVYNAVNFVPLGNTVQSMEVYNG